MLKDESINMKLEQLFYDKEVIKKSYLFHQAILKSIFDPTLILSDILEIKNFDLEDTGYLITNLLATNFIMNKEKVINEDNNKYEFLVDEAAVFNIISKYALKINEDRSFIIDDMTYKSSIDFVNTIRNKFAHGQTIYDPKNKKIVIIANNKKVNIDLNLILELNELLFDKFDVIKKAINEKKTFIKIPKILSNDDYILLAKSCVFEKYQITSNDDNDYNLQNNKEIINFFNNISNNLYEDKKINEFENEMIIYCNENNLKLNKEIFEFDDLTQLEKQYIIKKCEILKIKSKEKNIDKNKQLLIFKTILDESLNLNNSNYYLKHSNKFILEYINFIIKNKFNVNLQQFSSYKNGINMEIVSKIIPYMFIMKYNYFYSFNLETSLFETLDFNRFLINDNDISINTYCDLEEDKLNKQIILKEKEISNLKIKKEEMIRNIRQQEEILKNHLSLSLKENLGKNIIKLNQLKNQILSVENYKLILDDIKLQINNDKIKRPNYYQNKNIFNHIRNSLAHGNFEIVFDGANVNEFKIIIKDIYQEKVTFEMNTTMNTIINLTSITVYNAIIESIDNEIIKTLLSCKNVPVGLDKILIKK
ncbi:MAG: hypothetical protein PHN42_00765 [Bacilli bacterium]|nr:hypothetical protein [Bacilli bacterium]